MKKLMIFVSVISALLLVSCGKKQDKNGWFTNFNDAKKVAESKDKAILLFVNSNMDVERSEKGVEAVLSKEFVDSVKDKYVCVHFDFTVIPDLMDNVDKEISSKEQKALENKRAELTEQFRIADQYGIQTTPIFNILTKEGYYITEPACEFSSSSVEGYVGAIFAEDEIVANYKDRVSNLKKGSKLEQVRAIDSLYKDAAEIHRVAMYDLVKKVISLDSKNESGLLGYYYFQLANLDAYNKIVKDNDFESAEKIYIKYSENEFIEPEDAQTLYYMAARFYSRLPNAKIEELANLLEKSLQKAPESEVAGDIKQILDSVNKTIEEQNVANSAENVDSDSSAEKAESSETNSENVAE